MIKLAFSNVTGKDAAVREWVRRKLGKIDHELRVARAARELFRLTAPWHELTATHARLLSWGSLVHDVGRAIEEKKHAQRGARMILESRTLPLSESELRSLACLTRHHKGPVPEAGAEECLDHKVEDGKSIRVLLSFLRAADALDSRWLHPPQLVFSRRGRTLRVDGYVACDPVLAAETFGTSKKFRLLEELLDCEIRTAWYSAKHLRLAV